MTTTNFESYLAAFSGTDWLEALNQLLPCVHEVDRDAVQVWFRFYPLELHRYLANADDRDEAVRGLALQGDFELRNQIDTSHHFLYGSRYWTTVKALIEAEAEAFKEDGVTLADAIKKVGMAASKKLKVERQLVTAIAAVGLMTVNQVGIEAFKAAAGETQKPEGIMAKSPDAIIASRAKDDSQGMFGFLKTVDKKFSVKYSNARLVGKFEIMNDQQIASASALDRSRNWRDEDERCWEGVVPVECLSASCGTCWVGVVGGKEKLSEVAPRERRSMAVFGYGQTDDERPFLRLACQAKAYGNASIVIPPWNGVFGKKVYGNVDDLELEPNTTSAKKLRETLATAVPGE